MGSIPVTSWNPSGTQGTWLVKPSRPSEGSSNYQVLVHIDESTVPATLTASAVKKMEAEPEADGVVYHYGTMASNPLFDFQVTKIKTCLEVHRVSTWAEYVSSRLEELANRTHEHGKSYPDLEMLNRARMEIYGTLKADTPTPSVVPSEAGGVGLIWHKAGWDVEIEFDPEGSFVWARDRSTGETIYEDLDTFRGELSDILTELSAD
jgi:hypothetical protein